MKLTDTNLEDLRALAVDAAQSAASLIQKNAGAETAILSKSGGDTLASQILTEVDLASQKLILKKLDDSIGRYELGLLTEESQDDSSRHQRDYFWCIDPLDGTLPFTENQSGYSVSIALVSREGTPLIGAIADPRTGSVYHAQKGRGAFQDEDELKVPLHSDATNLTWVMDRSFLKNSKFSTLQKELESFADSLNLSGVTMINHGGAAMNAIWVLQNSPGLYFKFPKLEDGGGSIWDFAATACVFAELKIQPTNMKGSPLELNREGSSFMNHGGSVYASSQQLAEFARQLYQSF